MFRVGGQLGVLVIGPNLPVIDLLEVILSPLDPRWTWQTPDNIYSILNKHTGHPPFTKLHFIDKTETHNQLHIVR